MQETEPGALTYQWFRTGTAEEPKIVVLEMYVFFRPAWTKNKLVQMLTSARYADKAAVDSHMTGPPLTWFMETEKKEGNFGAPPELLSLEQFAGFAR